LSLNRLNYMKFLSQTIPKNWMKGMLLPDWSIVNWSSQSSISELPVLVVLAILDNTSLKLKSEDCLYEMITSLISINMNYALLLECVKYEYLSSGSIKSFVHPISESFEFLTITI
jgi:hypothetical protein